MPKPPHPHNPNPNRPPNQKPKPPKDIPFATRLLDQNLSSNLVVDGSAAPVEFMFVPADDVKVTELSLIFEDKGQFGFGDSFLGQEGPLVNGLDIELQVHGESVVANFKTTRELLEYASPDGFYTGEGKGTYVIKATRQFSKGLKLKDRDGDFIKLTIQDDLTKLGYGVASVLGYTD